MRAGIDVSFFNRGRYAHTSTEGGRLEIDLLASRLASQTRLASSPPTPIHPTNSSDALLSLCRIIMTAWVSVYIT